MLSCEPSSYTAGFEGGSEWELTAPLELSVGPDRRPDVEVVIRRRDG